MGIKALTSIGNGKANGAPGAQAPFSKIGWQGHRSCWRATARRVWRGVRTDGGSARRRQDRHDLQDATAAARALRNFLLRHPAHEVFGGFECRRRGGGDVEGVPGNGKAVAFAGGGQQAVMADALEPRRQHMLQKAFDEHGAWDAGHPLAAGPVGAHPQQHATVPDCHDSLVGDRRAVGIAGQVLQHLGGSPERGFGVDDPVALQ